MRSFEGSTEAHVSTDAAFTVWTDVSRWTEDGLVQRAELTGPFAVGSTIAVRIRGFPASKTTITRVQRPRLWVSQARVPGLLIIYDHEILEAGNGVRLTERANLSGPLAGVVARLIGRRLEELFAQTTAQVARQAETSPKDGTSD